MNKKCEQENLVFAYGEEAFQEKVSRIKRIAIELRRLLDGGQLNK